jgi:Zn-finger nucleic acid-binding protein
VKVDTCPECKGMWLDAGELDMIKYVDRNAIGRFVGSLFGQKP